MYGVMIRKKGVSLVELILSIAVLSFLSLYVIQMFIISNRLNKEAEVLDQSVILATQIFERIESSEGFKAFMQSPYASEGVVHSLDGKTEVDFYYDDTWQGVGANDAYRYRASLSHERVPALTYQMDYYKVIILELDQLSWEQIYELEMRKYD